MRIHGHEIEKATVRERLKPRPAPYWKSLGRGRALGFRKSAIRPGGTWIARWTEKIWASDEVTFRYHSESLGPEDKHLDYSAALSATLKYCERRERECAGRSVQVDEDVVVHTVEDACKAYVKKLRAEKGDLAASDAEHKLKPVVYGTPFGAVRLSRLSARHVEQWRNGLITPNRKRNSANRHYRSWVAAMNWAKSRGHLDSDHAWKSVGPFPVEDGTRQHYLESKQRAALLASCDREKSPEEIKQDPHLTYCTADLGNLLRGLFFTAARPGELAKARVSDLNVRDLRLRLVSAKNKKGQAKPRLFYLYEEAALTFFIQMALNKGPMEYLMTKADGSAWVYEDGKPRYREWGWGFKAAIRDANKRLPQALRIDEQVVTYCVRHMAITDMLSEDYIDQLAVEKLAGTSAEMIQKNYYKLVESRLKEQL